MNIETLLPSEPRAGKEDVKEVGGGKAFSSVQASGKHLRDLISPALRHSKA